MYTNFFGLNEKPFAITPNPRYLFMSERHTEALAHLIYGVKDSGGFIQLTGEVGTGKTTLIRGLLQRLPKNAVVALILNPQLSAPEFLAAILTELGVEQPERSDSLKALTDALNRCLLDNYSRGRRTILIVDEAQNFSVDVLEQIRLLTNLETSKHKLLQITLIGQPELRTMLARNDLRQLAQRITARYHLEPLTQDETSDYIRHRLRVAGATRQLFSDGACRELYRLSGGIPRIINVIADRALLGAYTANADIVETKLVRRAAAEVYGEDRRGRWATGLRLAAAAGLAALVIGAAAFTALRFASTPERPPAAAAAPAALPTPAARSPAAADTTAALAREAGIDAPAPASAEQRAAIHTRPAAGQPAAVNPLGDLLAEQGALTDARAAFDNLFALWGIELDPDTPRACEQAREYQLNCLFQRGSLANLERLDRPAILSLQDTQGNTHQVVLTTLHEQTAHIAIGDQVYPVAVDELNDFWFGEYLLLWRPQLATVKSFLPGMTDPDVAWLRESLSTIQGTPIPPNGASDVYDQNLEARVREYQGQRRLVVDGMVGQQTQIVINTDLNIGAPRLVRNN